MLHKHTVIAEDENPVQSYKLIHWALLPQYLVVTNQHAAKKMKT